MRLADWIPGLGHWRRGNKGMALALFSLSGFLLGLLIWRWSIVEETLAHAVARLAGSGAPHMPRFPDFLFSTAAILALLCGLALYSRRASRRLDRRAPAASDEGDLRADVWRRFRRNRLALWGAAIVLVLYLVALLCPFLAPCDPAEIGGAEERHLAPSMEHPLGTDDLSRDVLSRVLYGSRVSLIVGLLAMAMAIGIGTIYGAVAGYFGGRIDGALMRLVDVFLAFPTVVLIITIMGLWKDWLQVKLDAMRLEELLGLDPWVGIVGIAIGLMSWMAVARLVRGQFLALREREFFLAARALGAGTWRLILRHLLPNSLTPIIVAATLGVGNTILLEAGLSYLGLGVQAPTPSWGNIVFDNKGAILSMAEWWIPFSAGLAIVITVVGYNLLGDGLRDALDPRLRS